MGFLSNFGDVIGAAGAGPLALVALLSLLMATLALKMFSTEHAKVKIAVFVTMFIGVAMLVLALMNGLGNIDNKGNKGDSSETIYPETEKTVEDVGNNTDPKADTTAPSEQSGMPSGTPTQPRMTEQNSINENSTPKRPCSIGPYIVFFEWEESRLDVHSKAIIAKIANNFKDCGDAIMVIDGHADTLEESALELSEYRTLSVMDYMVRNGVPSSSIRRNPVGASQLRVPTAPDVREEQNRRVEVTFGPR